DVVTGRLRRLGGRAVGPGDDVVLRLVDDVADVLGDLLDDMPGGVHPDTLGTVLTAVRDADLTDRRGTPLDHAAGGAELAREAYRLDVGADGATVTAADVPGLLHGVTTLGHLRARGHGTGTDAGPGIPAATVVDV